MSAVLRMSKDDRGFSPAAVATTIVFGLMASGYVFVVIGTEPADRERDGR